MLVIQWFEQSSPNLNSDRNPFLLVVLIVIEGYLHSIHNTNESNNEINYHSLLFYLYLFNITILYDYPLQSSSFTWWTSFNRCQSYRMIKYSTFLFWTLNQTRLTQFRSLISHKSLIFILNIDNTKDWIMLAKPVCVVIKWWKRVDGWLDPKSMTKNDGAGFWTNKVSIE